MDKFKLFSLLLIISVWGKKLHGQNSNEISLNYYSISNLKNYSNYLY